MWCVVSFFLVTAILIVHHVSASRISFTTDKTASNEVYAQFLQSWGHRQASTASDNVVSHNVRRDYFEATCARVMMLNSRPNALWTAGLNYFADYTPGEKRQMLGYKRRSSQEHDVSRSTALIDTDSQVAQIAQASVDWRPSLRSSANVRNQGICGSCWATAAVGAMEMHAEITEKQPLDVKLSHSQLVDCVPNSKHCGGRGGCNGATAELAYEYVKNNGLAAETEYHGLGRGMGGNIKYDCHAASKPSITIKDWVTLPLNQYEPLRRTVQETGPVVVSVDASKWWDYKSGIFDCDSPDATVNHAVVVVGYGEDKGTKYWTIRNSWGPTYGENGYIRLKRHDGEGEFCGTDKRPQEGVGCDGGAKSLPVCGACGMYSDSSYPVGVAKTET